MLCGPTKNNIVILINDNIFSRHCNYIPRCEIIKQPLIGYCKF